MDFLQGSEEETRCGWSSEEEEGGQHLQNITSANLETPEKRRHEVNTVKQTSWALNCFQTWLKLQKIKIDFKSVTKRELGTVLRQCYGSIRTTKGELYSVSSYLGLRSALNRYINDPPISRSWSLIQDPEFASANAVLKGVVQELRKAHSHPISPEDQHILKCSKALNPDNPWGLLNKVWFDVQLHFGREGKGNWDLKPDSFTLNFDKNGAKYFTMTFNEETSPQDREHCGVAMSEERGSPFCPVLSLEKYLRKIPPDATSLYLKPKQDVVETDTYWYSSVPLGGKHLFQMLPRLCKEAGTRMYTYHNLTATARLAPPQAGFERREIMAVTGDRMKRLPSRPASSGKSDKMIRLSMSEMRTMVEQEIQKAMKNNEAKLQGLMETIQKLESEVDYESSIQKLEARINVVAKRAEAALAYITKTEKKNPLSSLGNVNIIKNQTVRTVPEAKKRSDSMVDAELFQMMENTKKSLKKMHSENEAVKAVELPAPVLTQNGSPKKGNVRLIKKESEDMQESAHAEEQAQFEEPKAKRVKVECVSANQSNISKRRDSQEEELSYPPLPSTPFPSVLNMEAASYSIPQRPDVHVALIKAPPGLSVLWNVEKEDPCAAPMDSYSVYITAEKVKGSGVFPAWKTIGEVRAIELPMCVMINKYKPGHKLCVAVVGKDIFHRFGPFSKVVSVVIPD